MYGRVRYEWRGSKQYGNLKEDLANQFPKDIEAYMDGKEAFVTELERTALE